MTIQTTTRGAALLGPQRSQPTLRAALDGFLAPGQPVAVISAGWEEREAELDELLEHVGRPAHNLSLFGRAEAVFEADRELHAELRGLHDTLRELQKLYRLRLRHLVPAADLLLRRDAPSQLIDPEREAAIDSLRALDAHHLGRVSEIARDVAASCGLHDRDSIAGQRAELAGILSGVGALCVAGGHVGILYNRLWLFGILGLVNDLPDLPVVAWSAGAMALAERIVLFHDSPPQGKGHAEVLGPGLGLLPGVVPLPDAKQRLRLEDPVRVQMLARRFEGATCVALDPGAYVQAHGGPRDGWVAVRPTSQLTREGTVVPVMERGAA